MAFPIHKQVSSLSVRGGPALPEFDVTIVTVRFGVYTLRVAADDTSAAHDLIQAECDRGENQSPPEWCTDEVTCSVVNVRRTSDLAGTPAVPLPGEPG
jgi:hypothetical protein